MASDDLPGVLGNRIRLQRIAAGLTQAALGTRAGGTRDVPLSTLRRSATTGSGWSSTALRLARR